MDEEKIRQISNRFDSSENAFYLFDSIAYTLETVRVEEQEIYLALERINSVCSKYPEKIGALLLFDRVYGNLLSNFLGQRIAESVMPERGLYKVLNRVTSVAESGRPMDLRFLRFAIEEEILGKVYRDDAPPPPGTGATQRQVLGRRNTWS